MDSFTPHTLISFTGTLFLYCCCFAFVLQLVDHNLFTMKGLHNNQKQNRFTVLVIVGIL